MTSETEEGAGAPRDGAESATHTEFEDSLRQFAEGATALTAASIRMQMMMLEQARGMMDDFATVMTEAAGDREKDR